MTMTCDAADPLGTIHSAHPAAAEAEQRREILLGEGARLHTGFTDRSDHCSLAVLDRDGMVISWYDRSFGAAPAAIEVLYRHVSQFYMPSDVVAGVPGRTLQCATNRGIDTQEGWRRRPGGAIYWGTTVVEVIVGSDGHTIGFAHVTRRSQGPLAVIHASVRQRTSRRRARTQVRWSDKDRSATAHRTPASSDERNRRNVS